MGLCFDHATYVILLCSYVSHAYAGQALCLYLLFTAHMVGGSSVNCAQKMYMKPIKLSLESYREIHFLSHTLMSGLSPSPSLSSIIGLLQGKKQHST